MQYHQIVIFTHRPWVSKTYLQPQNPKQGPGYLHARRTCIDSATAISHLLRLYEHHYTFRRINNQVVAIIFTAALILIYVTISNTSISSEMSQKDNSRASMAAHLNVCFRALDSLEQSFENAKRTRDFLVNLQRKWQNRMRKAGKRTIDAPPSSRVQNGPYEEESSAFRKRSRFDPMVIGQIPPSKIPISSTIPVAGNQPLSELQSNFEFDDLDLNWIQDTDFKFLSDVSPPTIPPGQMEDATVIRPNHMGIPWWNSPNSAK